MAKPEKKWAIKEFFYRFLTKKFFTFETKNFIRFFLLNRVGSGFIPILRKFMPFRRSKSILISCMVFLLFSLLEAQIAPPDLTNADAHQKTLELFAAHIKYKEMSPEISRRALINYLEELDPLKSYLTKDEVVKWTEPSTELLDQIVADFNAQKFTQFELIYNSMLGAIERRNLLEERVSKLGTPSKPMSPKEIQDADWVGSVDELQLKLLNIHAIQSEAAIKLPSKDQQDLFFQRVKKRRISYEKNLLQTSSLEQKKQALSTFLKAVASSLDVHTIYFTPQEAKQFLIQVQQRLFGIGAQLRDDLNGLTIVDIIDGGPAHLEGTLKINDKIIAVDHEPVIGMDIVEAIDLIRGERGTPVVLTVLRERAPSETSSERFDIEITRDEVVLKESRYETKTIPYGDGVIGYLALHSFYQDPVNSSSSDLEQAILGMRSSQNLKGIILDLRSNSGGLLPQAVQVTGLFIKSGVVASIKDYTGSIKRLRNLVSEVAWDGPLIVLINKTSASASEIVAMTLSDYGRALVIGDETSFGKGSYQTFTFEGHNPERINPQGEYKVTRGSYYTVSGNTPQLVGVKSDIVVPGVLSQMEIGERHSKYPLENDTISPSFEDDLSDVHPLFRMRLRKTLGKNTQKKNVEIFTLVETLSRNSKARISSSQNYQVFLEEINNQNRYDLDPALVGQTDLQLDETVNIMKELIFYTSLKKPLLN